MRRAQRGSPLGWMLAALLLWQTFCGGAAAANVTDGQLFTDTEPPAEMTQPPAASPQQQRRPQHNDAGAPLPVQRQVTVQQPARLTPPAAQPAAEQTRIVGMATEGMIQQQQQLANTSVDGVDETVANAIAATAAALAAMSYIKPASSAPVPAPAAANAELQQKAAQPAAAVSSGMQCQARVEPGPSWTTDDGSHARVLNLYLTNAGAADLPVPYVLEMESPSYSGVVTAWNWAAATGALSSGAAVSGPVSEVWEFLLADSANTVNVGCICTSSAASDFLPQRIAINGQDCQM